jgi:hypothetical protein
MRDLCVRIVAFPPIEVGKVFAYAPCYGFARTGAGSQVSRVFAFRRDLHGRATAGATSSARSPATEASSQSTLAQARTDNGRVVVIIDA